MRRLLHILFSASVGMHMLATVISAQQPQLLGTIPSDTINSLFGTEMIPLGDQNGDGYDDLLIWDFRLVGQLYYGGPSVDSNPVIRFEAFNRIGGFCGLVDGDQYIDIVMQAVNGQKGTGYIYAGFQDPTDVPYDYEPTLPVGYDLSQNYPSLFNPATTIEFSLPRRSQVRLAMFDLLGREVISLISTELSAGNHSGVEAASGVYFYRLETDNLTTRTLLQNAG